MNVAAPKFIPRDPEKVEAVVAKAGKRKNDVTSHYLRFSTKPKALLASGLSEVLLMDADATIFIRPEELFTTELYQDTGTLFLHDKVSDWWPTQYGPHDPQWLPWFIRGGYTRDYNGSALLQLPLSAPTAKALPLRTESHNQPSSFLTHCFPDQGSQQNGRKKVKARKARRVQRKRNRSGSQGQAETHASRRRMQSALVSSRDALEASSGGGVLGADQMGLCSVHRQESSLLLFDKQRQHRATRILADLTQRLGTELYGRIYGDKETYWLACELAQAPYAFSHWALSHYGLRNASTRTCPEHPNDPRFAHYMPDYGPPRLLSLNQVRLRPRESESDGGNTGRSLAASRRISYTAAGSSFKVGFALLRYYVTLSSFLAGAYKTVACQFESIQS
jgi:hypothetical protein